MCHVKWQILNHFGLKNTIYLVYPNAKKYVTLNSVMEQLAKSKQNKSPSFATRTTNLPGKFER
jgi:hypothetical protein